MQYQQERSIRGQLEEQEVVQLLDAVARKDRDLAQANFSLQEQQQKVQR